MRAAVNVGQNQVAASIFLGGRGWPPHLCVGLVLWEVPSLADGQQDQTHAGSPAPGIMANSTWYLRCLMRRRVCKTSVSSGLKCKGAWQALPYLVAGLLQGMVVLMCRLVLLSVCTQDNIYTYRERNREKERRTEGKKEGRKEGRKERKTGKNQRKKENNERRKKKEASKVHQQNKNTNLCQLANSSTCCKIRPWTCRLRVCIQAARQLSADRGLAAPQFLGRRACPSCRTPYRSGRPAWVSGHLLPHSA